MRRGRRPGSCHITPNPVPWSSAPCLLTKCAVPVTSALPSCTAALLRSLPRPAACPASMHPSLPTADRLSRLPPPGRFFAAAAPKLACTFAPVDCCRLRLLGTHAPGPVLQHSPRRFDVLPFCLTCVGALSAPSLIHLNCLTHPTASQFSVARVPIQKKPMLCHAEWCKPSAQAAAQRRPQREHPGGASPLAARALRRCQPGCR